MCQHCKQKPLDTVRLEDMLGRAERFVSTGVNLNETTRVVFTVDGEQFNASHHAVGLDWMRQHLPVTAVDGDLYLIDADERSESFMFGAVCGSFAYLFIITP